MTGDPPVALVTGANRGIGLETARQLAGRGLNVLLGSRDPARGLAAAEVLAAGGVEVAPVLVDVTDLASVTSLVQRLQADHGRLDVQVNNAGVFVGASVTETTAEQLRTTFDTNVFGVATLINSLLPLLRGARAPRIVNVSSTTASLTLTACGADIPGDATVRMAYCASKAALNMLTIHYAKAFAGNSELGHLKINSATPGYTATDMNGFRGTRSVVDAARIIVKLATLPDDGPSGGFFSDQDLVPW